LKSSQDTPSGRTPPPKEPLLPPGYRLDYSEPNVLTLLSPQEKAVVARFSARGYMAEMIEREAWEHHRNATRPTT
jgi:hypothetical protein